MKRGKVSKSDDFHFGLAQGSIRRLNASNRLGRAV